MRWDLWAFNRATGIGNLHRSGFYE